MNLDSLPSDDLERLAAYRGARAAEEEREQVIQSRHALSAQLPVPIHADQPAGDAELSCDRCDCSAFP